MSSTLSPFDADQAMQWLDRARVPHYVCGECHGLHLNDIQALDGVMESRLFVEADCVMFFSELEVRPSMLMPLMAELSRINLAYLHLKVFIDLIDESLPRLVVQDTIPHTAGLTYEQFHLFVENCVQATLGLVQECQQQGFLTGNENVSSGPRSAMH